MIKPQTRYYARVKALNQSSESDYSNTVSVTTLPSNVINAPVSAPASPLINKVVPFKYYAYIYIEKPSDAQQVLEYKLSLSTLSDFSTLVISNVTCPVSTLTTTTRNGITYYTIMLPALVAGTTYYLRIQASNQVALSDLVTTSFATYNAVDRPVLLGAKSLSSINAELSWVTVPGATSYRLDVASNPDFTVMVVNNLTVTGTSHLVQALTETTQYYYRVRAFNGTILSSNSQVQSFTTLNGTATYTGFAFNLDSPVISNSKEILPDSLRVTWGKVANASSYTIQLSTSSTFSTYVENITTALTQVRITGLNAGTVYFLRIKAEHLGISSAYTVLPISTPALSNASTAPTILPNSINYSTKIVIAWVKRSYATNYYLEVSSASNFSTILQSLYLGDVDTYEVTNLAANSTYYARVRGINASVVSPVSTSATFTTSAALPALTGLGSLVRDVDVSLSWSPSASYSDYLVSVYIKATDGTLTTLHPSLFYKKSTNNASTFTIDILLKPETDYQWQVEAVTATGDSFTSALQSFTTLAKAPTLQLNSATGRIGWSGQLNRITVALDDEFKTCIPGWIDRQLGGNSISAKYLDIKRLIRDNPSLFIKGRYINGALGSAYCVPIRTDGTPCTHTVKVTSDSISVKWSELQAVSYGVRVEYDAGAGTWAPLTGYVGVTDIGSSPEITLPALTSNTSYRIYLYYKTGAAFVYQGTPLEIKTNAYLDAFTGAVQLSNNVPLLSMADISFDTLSISTVNTNSNSITVLRVSRDSSANTYEQYHEIASGTTITEIECEPNTNYYVEAIAVNKTTGTRSNTVSTIATSLDIPYSPSVLTGVPVLSNVVVLNQSEARLSYSVVSNSTGYRLEVSKSVNFAVLDYDVDTYFSQNTLTVVNLLPTVIYYARLVAFNQYYVTPYSNVITIDTTP